MILIFLTGACTNKEDKKKEQNTLLASSLVLQQLNANTVKKNCIYRYAGKFTCIDNYTGNGTGFNFTPESFCNSSVAPQANRQLSSKTCKELGFTDTMKSASADTSFMPDFYSCYVHKAYTNVGLCSTEVNSLIPVDVSVFTLTGESTTKSSIIFSSVDIQSISLYFTREMDASKIQSSWISLKKDTGEDISFTINLISSYENILKLNVNIARKTGFTISISKDVIDYEGLKLDKDYSISIKSDEYF